MGRKDIYKDAKGFDKNPQNINRTGLNRKLISSVNVNLENLGYKEATKNDIISCYLRLIQLTIPELESMVRDNSQPALVRIVGKEILSGKGFDVIEKILDRGIGKPTQNVEMKQIQDKDMTPEETRDFVISTLKELKKRDE
jgi:hypothetical protein